MHGQLTQIADELLEAMDRLRALADRIPTEMWPARTDPERWSVAECVAHLNLTASASLPSLERGVHQARRLGAVARGRYRRGFLGWLLWSLVGPPVRVRITTPAAFVPRSLPSVATLVTEFERLQDAQMALLRAADGLPLDRVRMVSPFHPRIRYNLYSFFAILARHQHRHLWQAEQVWVGRPR